MIYDLPKELEVGGVEYPIRSDYRAILDILMALSDHDLEEWERVYSAVSAFYVDFKKIPAECYEEAVRQCFWFINGGEDEDNSPKQPRLIDWEQDFPLIVAPINRVLVTESRSAEYLHWWSFLGAFREVGECTLAQVVRVRYKLARHEKLDKVDKEWLNKNKRLVEFKRKYTEADENLLEKWI